MKTRLCLIAGIIAIAVVAGVAESLSSAGRTAEETDHSSHKK